MHPHLRWWLEESNVPQGQPLHPIKHALQIFTDTSKERWGAHLNEHTARGTWSLPESKLQINYLELKAVFLALKEFQDLCPNKIILVTLTDNTTGVSYRNKEGGMRSGPLSGAQCHLAQYHPVLYPTSPEDLPLAPPTPPPPLPAGSSKSLVHNSIHPPRDSGPGGHPLCLLTASPLEPLLWWHFIQIFTKFPIF